MLITEEYFFSELSSTVGRGVAQTWLEENVLTRPASTGDTVAGAGATQKCSTCDFEPTQLRREVFAPASFKRSKSAELPKARLPYQILDPLSTVPLSVGSKSGRAWHSEALHSTNIDIKATEVAQDQTEKDSFDVKSIGVWQAMVRRRSSRSIQYGSLGNYSCSLSSGDKRGLLFTDAAHLLLDAKN